MIFIKFLVARGPLPKEAMKAYETISKTIN